MATRPPTPLLDALEKNRILSVVELGSSGIFRIQEECDCNFYEEFTAEQLIALADELRALALSQE